MSRWCIVLFLAGTAAADAQQAEPKKPLEKPEVNVQDPAQLPPEENVDVKPEDYTFNPVKSKRDVEVGKGYFKKGNFKAAAGRFLTATKWNDGNAEAWFWLGEAEEKRDDQKAARAAFEKYLQLAPESRNAGDVRKRIAKLKS